MNSSLNSFRAKLIPLTCFLFIACFIIWFIESEIIYLLALIMGFLLFILFRSIKSGSPFTVSLAASNIRIRISFFKLLAYMSIFYLLIHPLVSRSTPAINYVSWSSLQLSGFLHIISALLVSSFLPGYVLFHFICGKEKFGLIERIVFVFALSLLFTASTTYALVLLGFNFVSISVILVGLNILLLVLYIIHKTVSKALFVHARTFRFSYGHLVLLCLIIFTLLVGWYTVPYFVNFTGFDIWRHLGVTLHLTRQGGSELFTGPEGLLTHYPPWVFMYLGSYLWIAGGPVVNSILYAYPLWSLTILSFYLMCRQIFRKDYRARVSILATVIWALFSGFTWIQIAIHKLAGTFPNLPEAFRGLVSPNIVVGDVSYNFNPWVYGFSPVMTGFFAFFTLVYLSLKILKSRAKIQDLVLIFVVFAVGFLTSHQIEVIVFLVVYLPILSILCKGKETNNLRKVLIALSLASVFCAFNLLLSLKLSSALVTQLIPFLFVPLAFLIFSLKRKVRTPRWNISVKIKTPLLILLLYCYLASFLIWVSVQGTLAFLHIPIYSLPVSLGVAGVLTLFGLYLFVFFDRKRLPLGVKLFLFSIPVLIVLMEVLRFLYWNHSYIWASINANFTILTPANKLRYFLGIVASIVAAYTLKLGYSKFKIGNRKNLLFCSLALLIIVGSCSTLLSVDFWRHPEAPELVISSLEFDALDYLYSTLPSNTSVLTLTKTSQENLNHFVDGGLMVKERGLILSTTNPEFALWLLRDKRIGYIYLHTRDIIQIQKSAYNSSYVSALLSYLPRIFENPEVTIYKVPQLTPPLFSNLKISVREDDYLWLNILSLSEVQYSLSREGDLERLEKEDIILLSDPKKYIWIDPYSREFEDLKGPSDFLLIADDNQSSFWFSSSGGDGSVGTPTLSDDAEENRSGSNCLKFFTPSGEGGWAWLNHIYDTVQDWSSYEFLVLHLYGLNDRGSMFIHLIDEDAAQRRFDFKDTWFGWKRLVIPLNDYEYDDGLDISKVKAIKFRWNTVGTRYLDGLSLARPILVLNPEIKSLLKHLYNGGTIIATDLNINGFFTSNFSIKIEDKIKVNGFISQEIQQPLPDMNAHRLVLENSNISVAANYTTDGETITPFILSKTGGNGRIILVNLSVDAIPEETRRQILGYSKSIVSSFGINLNSTNPLEPKPELVRIIREGFLLNGEAKVITRELFLRGSRSFIKATISTLGGRSVSYEHINSIGFSSQVKLEVTSNKIELTPVNETHALLRITEPYALRIFSQNLVNATLLKNSESIILPTTEIRIEDERRGIEVFTFLPALKMKGKTLFSRYPFISQFTEISYNNALIKGEVSCELTSISQDLILLRNFEYAGTFIDAATDNTDQLWQDGMQGFLNHWTIVPWPQIIFSRDHVLIIALSLLFFTILHTLRRKN